MAATPYSMAYAVEIGPKADAQLDKLDAAIGVTVESKIAWLGENAPLMIHRRLVGMPDDLAGLCKLRVGHWRILYWIYPAQKTVRIYRIAHRSEVYRDL
jgi:mRNA-degrading endonuclease RelE of RelBE toxin-antitoxin system